MCIYIYNIRIYIYIYIHIYSYNIERERFVQTTATRWGPPVTFHGFRPQSYVTTRFMLCFSAWQCAFMCIFLHTCHADRRVGWGLGVGVGGGVRVGGGRGVGGGLIAFCRLLPVASSFRHAPDVTLYRSSLAILDTLMMLRSIDLLLQSSTRSRCYAL